MGSALKYISYSKRGLKRNRNQDRVFIVDTELYSLFAVFDGVSSLSESYLFINHYIKKLKSNLNHLLPTGNNLGQVFFETHRQALIDNREGMSTLSVLFYSKIRNRTKYVNIGDSRIYQFSNQFIEKLTHDDALQGKSNALTKCLGLPDLSLNDFVPIEIGGKGNFLICTDGFYELMLGDLKEYFAACNFKNFGNIKKKFSILQRRKNYDDSTYILIKNEISS